MQMFNLVCCTNFAQCAVIRRAVGGKKFWRTVNCPDFYVCGI